MTEKERELKGIGIEVHTSEKTGKITKMVFTPEGKANPWYRKSLDRNRDGVLCIEIRKDMSQLVHNLSKLNVQVFHKCFRGNRGFRCSRVF